MPKAFEFQILGLKELQDKLEELDVKTRQRILRVALKKAATRVRDMMVQLAPVDTGFLKKHFSIKTKVKRVDVAASAFVGPDGKIDYPK